MEIAPAGYALWVSHKEVSMSAALTTDEAEMFQRAEAIKRQLIKHGHMKKDGTPVIPQYERQ